MVNPQMVMYEEEFNQIQSVVDRLVRDANAKVVFICLLYTSPSPRD